MIFEGAFKNRKVFITGHTGFKGSWLSVLLQSLGASVYGFALPPEHDSIYASTEDVFTKSWLQDIRNRQSLYEAVKEAKPDLIFHLAAQPLVLDSYKDPVYTYETNVIGTVNVLDVVRELAAPCAVVVITTDKVYENKEWVYPYRETDRLGGYDPYSASKACTELVVDSYRKSFFPPSAVQQHGIALASVRAGNVIGGGDWSANRIIPDIVRAFAQGEELQVRHPYAVRPWQHVLDALYGYCKLAVQLLENREDARWHTAWNFGPAASDNLTVKEIVDMAIKQWGGGQYQITGEKPVHHEAGLLRLDCSKAHQQLNWFPVWNATEAVAQTIHWYKQVMVQQQSAGEAARQQIAMFLKAAG